MQPNSCYEMDSEAGMRTESETEVRSESEQVSTSDSDSESDQGVLDYLRKHSTKRLRANDFGDLQGCIINPANINTSFDDIYISPDALDALDPLLLQLDFPDQFQVGILARSPPTGLLLYGPPGTGKTQFVRALAKEVNASLLSVSGANMRDPHKGETEKKIQRLFACARAHKGLFFIFVDEADSVFGGEGRERNDVYQFLLEMDGMTSSQMRHVMVIAASNRPFDIDEGVLRRLGRRIYVSIPDTVGREQILRLHLRYEILEDGVDLEELAKQTRDYTGSDLKNLVYEAAITAVREIGLASKLGEGTQVRLFQQQGTIRQRIIRQDHLFQALKRLRPSLQSNSIQRIFEFHQRYGNTSQRRAQRIGEEMAVKRKRKRRAGS